MGDLLVFTDEIRLETTRENIDKWIDNDFKELIYIIKPIFYII